MVNIEQGLKDNLIFSTRLDWQLTYLRRKSQVGSAEVLEVSRPFLPILTGVLFARRLATLAPTPASIE